MSARVPPLHIETICHFSAPGADGDIISSFGWSGADASSPPDFDAVEAAFAEIMGQVNHNVIMTGITYNLGSADDDNPFVLRGLDVVGAGGGNMLPINNSWLLKKTTASGGRRNRGRNYWPGVSEGAVTDSGALEGGVQTGWETNISDWLDGMVAAGLQIVLLHQKAPFTPTIVEQVNIETRIATQRNRLAR